MDAVTDAYGDDRGSGAVGAFSAKAGIGTGSDVGARGNGLSVQPAAGPATNRPSGVGKISAGRLLVWHSLRAAD